MAERYDVFISYVHADAEQVQRLAENLRNLGLEVFLDAWEIAPGDVLVHQLDRGLLESRNGVLCVTPTALSRPWIREEYAALMTRAVERGNRLVPVLLADADLPPLLANRIYVDPVRPWRSTRASVHHRACSPQSSPDRPLACFPIEHFPCIIKVRASDVS